jgi:flagellar motor switch protein FliG
MSATALAERAEQGERLSGRQRVAILCMALGPAVTAQITRQLTPEEIELITYEIARMDTVDPAVVESVLFEWMETMRAAESLAMGGVDVARQILEEAFGNQKASYVFKRIQSQLSEAAGLQRLRKADPQHLGSMLRNEHPQTIALILAHLDPQQTVAILKEIGPTVGSAVIYRMARLDKVSPEMLSLIERALGPETDLNLSQGMSAAGGPAAVATVLNLVNPSMEKELLEGLATQDPDLCEQIKNLMFVFEDVTMLDNRSIQRLLREVESKELALALKVASEEVRQHIMAGMSKRAVEALNEEIEFLGPVRLRDVETAQIGIVAKVRMLEETGEIVLSLGGDDEVVA